MTDNGQATTPSPATAIMALRKRLGVVNRPLSIEALARRLGVSYTTVWKWEKGKRRPSPMARRLMRELLEKVDSEEARR